MVFDPLTFIERLAALVPRPRTHLMTYHGVLAPAAAWRDLVVPGAPLIALINDGLVVRKILEHLGLPTEPPPMAPARAPPEPEFSW